MVTLNFWKIFSIIGKVMAKRALTRVLNNEKLSIEQKNEEILKLANKGNLYAINYVQDMVKKINDDKK